MAESLIEIEAADDASVGHGTAMDLPMRWRIVAFWAKTLLAEDDGIGKASECRVCKAFVSSGDEHHRACSRRRLAETLAEIEPDLEKLTR